MELKDVQAIDTMGRVWYCDPEECRSMFRYWEVREMAKGTFSGVAKKLGLKPGEEWKVLAMMSPGSVDAVLKEMDAAGVQYMLVDAGKAWSRHDHACWADVKPEAVKKCVDAGGGRIIGGGGYNPFHIEESLDEIDKAVELYGCKFIFAHPISFGLRPDDKKMYPLYTKCLQLGIPVSFQVGHSAEALPSEPGHPMYADEIAMDFPDLTIILTHTGFPWIPEWISMIWRHANVYGNIGAYYPSDLHPDILNFMSGRGQNKVMWATNGFGVTRCKKEFVELPLTDDVKRKVLRDNAIKVYKLQVSK